jgi:phospholipase C
MDGTVTDARNTSDGAKDAAEKDAGDAGKHPDAGDGGASAEGGEDAGDGGVQLASLKHVVVIYLENHTFDNLFGSWPGADGLADGGAGIPQVGPNGVAYTTLPEYAPDPAGASSLDGLSLPNAPFDLTASPANFAEGALTNDLLHRFYQEQAQINGGKMDSYVLWNDESAGLSMGYWPTSTLPIAQWMQAHAKSVTVLDHFFHAAFGGSFLNHFWLISAQSPTFPNAPASIVAQPNDAGQLVAPLDTTSVPPNSVYNSGSVDGQVTPDGFAVNTTYSAAEPQSGRHLVTNRRARYSERPCVAA